MTRKIYALILATLVTVTGIVWIALVVTNLQPKPAHVPMNSAVYHSTPAHVRHV